MKKVKNTYHHGNLAESLLDAVDDIASQFGLEAVSLRACAKLIGVSPSSAFRHYADKRALLTAFAAKALHQLSDALEAAVNQTLADNQSSQSPDNDPGVDSGKHSEDDPFLAVCMAYIEFALLKPAYFRAMWREETIYAKDTEYLIAANRLGEYMTGGFAKTITDLDPSTFSAEELLAWSSVHGLANLFVEGPVAKDKTIPEKLAMARNMILALKPVF